SESTERDLCSWLATLGVDPYDPELPDELIDLLRNRLPRLSELLRRDFLEAAKTQSLSASVDWVEEASQRLDQEALTNLSAIQVRPQRTPLHAHETGYEVAGRLREELQISNESIADLSVILERCGWSPTPRIDSVRSPDGNLL